METYSQRHQDIFAATILKDKKKWNFFRFWLQRTD